MAFAYADALLEQMDRPFLYLDQKLTKESLYNAVWQGYHFAAFCLFEESPAAREIIADHGLELGDADGSRLMDDFVCAQFATACLEPSAIVQSTDVSETFRTVVIDFFSRGAETRIQGEALARILPSQAGSDDDARTTFLLLLDRCSCAGMMIGLRETELLLERRYGTGNRPTIS